ncbi:hypothetical protein [Photobacterium nomapromontoriensis]|uniref:hypothetical protein n=1 Tax=Photobacterium nomapromontoriensis TaxID=2910237 RepID=UPI003D0E4739
MIPILLISQFTEIKYQTEQCLYFCQQYMEEVHRIHTVSLEHSERAAADLAANEERLREREKAQRQFRQQLRELQRHNLSKQEQGRERLNAAQSHSQYAAEQRQFWSAQLDKANDWQQRAYNAWEIACQNTQRAAQALASAQSELNSAEQALRWKESQIEHVQVRQSDGSYRTETRYPDTSAERARVASAQLHVNSCQAHLLQAQVAEQRAANTLNKARKQVAGSQASLADARTGIELTGQQQDRATTALDRFNQAGDRLQELAAHADEIDRLLNEWSQIVEQLSRTLSSLYQHNDTEEATNRHLGFQLDDIEAQSYQLRGALDTKADLLAAFDMPLLTH